MRKLVRILKKEARHVGQQCCADSGWYGTNGAASVHDVMQWIPTVYISTRVQCKLTPFVFGGHPDHRMDPFVITARMLWYKQI